LSSADGEKSGLAAGELHIALSSTCGAQGEEDSPRWLGGMGPQRELITEPSVSLPLISFSMEKEQLLLKIYLGSICKVNCSLQKPANHSTAWYLCEVPVSMCFPHASGTVNLAAHKGRNFQAEGFPGFSLQHTTRSASPDHFRKHQV